MTGTTTKTAERIRTLHPQGKQGAHIEKDKYDVMRRALLRVIPRRKEGVAFKELPQLVKPHLDRKVYGPKVSVNWYLVTVKQDLEARKLVELVRDAKPQRVRRVSQGAR